jgi:PPOX class probable F420-dependent enzyme
MPPILFTAEEELFFQEQPVARMGTVDLEGQPHLIPICFVYRNGCFYSAIDAKPKRVAPHQLKRVRNILANPRVALLWDEYHADWSRLRYLRIQGEATLLTAGQEYEEAITALRQKYPQYVHLPLIAGQGPVIKIIPWRKQRWGQW